MNIFGHINEVRSKQPLIHHITNWVTIFDCAQVAKAFGASPVMAHAPEEVADMTALSSALVLNIGTLTSELINAMQAAVRAADLNGVPVIIDVCGSGATPYRDKSISDLLAFDCISIIKGNSSEIARIAGERVQTKGVDSGAVDADLSPLAQKLAQRFSCTVVITGPVDIVSDSITCYKISNGHAMMAQVVGTGCMAASAIGAFIGASASDLTASAAAGLVCYEVAAELAAMESRGPASFKLNLQDRIYSLTQEQIEAGQQIQTSRIQVIDAANHDTTRSSKD